MSRSYHYNPEREYLHFITTAVVQWLSLFQSFRRNNVLIDGLEYCRAQKGLRLHAYVIMPNHFHLIVSTKVAGQLPSIVRDLKRHTSRALTRCLEEERALFSLRILGWRATELRGHNRRYEVWQEGYHPVAIFSQRFLRQKLDYLHDNPVRKGFVRRPEDWLYSSAGDYVNDVPGVLRIDKLEL